MTRRNLYIAANLGFIVLVGVGVLIGSDTEAHPLYLVLLFLICSSPILCISRLNDRYALLAVFSGVYFIYFGALDLVHLLSGTSSTVMASGDILSQAEVVILVGLLLTQVAYLIGCLGRSAPPRKALKDWPEKTLVLTGTALWLISTWLVWKLRIEIITDPSIEAEKQGLGSLSGLQTIGFMLASYLQPLCVVILAYAQCRYRRSYMIPVLAIVLAVQMVLGFVADIKGAVLLGFALVALTKLLIDGTIPKLRFLLMAAIIAVVFPVLQANRMLRADLSNSEAAHNVVQILEKAIATTSKANSGSDRAQTFLERMTLKGSVEMIVARTGADVKYQNGRTLVPLLGVFIPRLLWPEKPDVPTGRVMNREFNLSDQEETYISPSHLGELYWNFGWLGVVVGMPVIGLLLGYIGNRCDLSHATNLTRILVLVGTIQLLVYGFESAIVPQYSVWIRSLLAIGMMNWVLARDVDTFRDARSHSRRRMPAPTDGTRSFSNLMP
jgi:hypothetical protein